MDFFATHLQNISQHVNCPLLSSSYKNWLRVTFVVWTCIYSKYILMHSLKLMTGTVFISVQRVITACLLPSRPMFLYRCMCRQNISRVTSCQTKIFTQLPKKSTASKYNNRRFSATGWSMSNFNLLNKYPLHLSSSQINRHMVNETKLTEKNSSGFSSRVAWQVN